MTQHPEPLGGVVGLPDTDRRWMIYVCECGLIDDTVERDDACEHRGHLQARSIEVVPVEALSVEREGRERAEKERDALREELVEADGLLIKTSNYANEVRSVGLGVAADLRKWAEHGPPGRGHEANVKDDYVVVHRAKLLAVAARLEGSSDAY